MGTPADPGRITARRSRMPWFAVSGGGDGRRSATAMQRHRWSFVAIEPGFVSRERSPRWLRPTVRATKGAISQLLGSPGRRSGAKTTVARIPSGAGSAWQAVRITVEWDTLRWPTRQPGSYSMTSSSNSVRPGRAGYRKGAPGGPYSGAARGHRPVSRSAQKEA
jgi:hypothetical protein